MSRGEQPFLRWAGGKRWLAKKLIPKVEPYLDGKFIEPFLGSGAMFFRLAPADALLCDLNEDLINAFRIVAEQPDRLLEAIRRLPVDSETYYQLRSSDVEEQFERAVRFIYLNRTCYGGIYRENKKGVFNTPYGGGSRTPAPLWEKSLLHRCHRLLCRPGVELAVNDFESAIAGAGTGDVVYCDPTYRSTNRTRFDRYGKLLFDWSDQLRLAKTAKEAMSRGALILISNVYCEEIAELYEGFDKVILNRSKSIGNASKQENPSYEYFIVLNPTNDHSILDRLESPRCILETESLAADLPLEATL